MKQAGTGVAIAEADRTLTQAVLRAELVRSYYTVLAAQERVELAPVSYTHLTLPTKA